MRVASHAWVWRDCPMIGRHVADRWLVIGSLDLSTREWSRDLGPHSSSLSLGGPQNRRPLHAHCHPPPLSFFLSFFLNSFRQPGSFVAPNASCRPPRFPPPPSESPRWYSDSKLASTATRLKKCIHRHSTNTGANS